MKKWVFVTGCYNSGTSLLASILALDSRFNFLPGEGARYSPELTRPEDIGWTRMWAKCIDYVSLPATKQPKKARALRKDWALFYSSNGFINLEKSIVTVPKIKWFGLNFSNAYFIGIVRDPHAVAKGIQNKAVPDPAKGENVPESYTMEMTAEQWVVANTMLISAVNEVENSTIISYENLILDPVRTINNVYRSIDESPPDMSFDGQVLFIENRSVTISKNENQQRISKLTSVDIDSVNTVIGRSGVVSKLSEFGLNINGVKIDELQ